jgi:hypothetical protein
VQGPLPPQLVVRDEEEEEEEVAASGVVGGGREKVAWVLLSVLDYNPGHAIHQVLTATMHCRSLLLGPLSFHENEVREVAREPRAEWKQLYFYQLPCRSFK